MADSEMRSIPRVAGARIDGNIVSASLCLGRSNGDLGLARCRGNPHRVRRHCSLDGRGDLLRPEWRKEMGSTRRSVLASGRRRTVLILATALEALPRFFGCSGTLPELVADAETKPRPRLGPSRGRAAAGHPQGRRGYDRKRPQLRVPLAG